MTEKMRILFVDDEECVLRSVRRLFMDDDYDIITASSAQEGLKVLEEGLPVHIVVADYGMPGMNGVAFLSRVCKAWPHTVRMVLSGYADISAIMAAINDGEIYKFITKPWNDVELKVAVANAAEKYRLQLENSLLLEKLRGTSDISRRADGGDFAADAIVQRQAAILASLPVGIVAIDAEGMVVEANRRWMDVAGWQSGVTGKPAAEVLPAAVISLLDHLAEGVVVRRLLQINGKMCMVTAQESPVGAGSGTVLVIDGV